MSLKLDQLNERCRKFMLLEVEHDVEAGNLYLSPRLNAQGREEYIDLLKSAIRDHDDLWLANEFRSRDLLFTEEQRRKPKGGYTIAQVPATAPDTLAEGEFNRFYIRGLCRIAAEDGIVELEIYRAKAVANPRSSSEALIGTRFPVDTLLTDARAVPGTAAATGIPHGPNSGLSVRLP